MIELYNLYMKIKSAVLKLLNLQLLVSVLSGRRLANVTVATTGCSFRLYKHTHTNDTVSTGTNNRVLLYLSIQDVVSIGRMQQWKFIQEPIKHQ